MDQKLEPILKLTPHVREKLRRVIAQEPGDPEHYALWVEVRGIKAGAYDHGLRVARLDEAGPDEVIQHDDDVPVIIPGDDVEKLRGATVTMEGDPVYGAVVVVNPNRPATPPIPSVSGDLTGDAAMRVAEVLNVSINPSIASHGGRAELVAVEGDTAYLRLSGGCQGCGMATVTLSEGIEVAIREAVPEILHVVDVTDHAAGTNPYFESAKK
ncbi:MAG: NifU family protein [Actinomycetota bacterium]|nr:NifU family protein [Actinomycetota bacterium]